MKRGTVRHPKLRALARQLGLEPFAALGLLDALLDWTFDYAPAGDVGRHSDAAIAEGIGWPAGSQELVRCLVDTGWLDRCCETHRLVIHDLNDHAPDSWRKYLKRKRIAFVSGQCPDIVRHPSDIVRQKSCPSRLVTPDTPEVSSPDVLPGIIESSEARPNSWSPETGDRLFGSFYETYPKKRHRPAALRAWKKAQGDRHAAEILRGVERWRQSAQWQAGWIEDPATFLNQRQWEDVPPAEPIGGVTGRTAGNLEAIKKGLRL